MFAVLATVVLSAKPVAFVVSAPSDAQTATAAPAVICRGRNKKECVDLTRRHDLLFGGLLPGSKLLGPSVSMPSDWPEEMAADYATAVKSCEGFSRAPAVACAQRAAEFLWYRSLKQARAEQVVEVIVSNQSAGLELRVTGQGVGASEQFTNSETVTASTARPKLDALVAKALQLNGNRSNANWVMSLEAPPLVGETGPAVTSAVSGTTTCANAPATLELEATSPLRQSVVARWAASKAGSSNGVAHCTMTETLHTEDLGLMTTDIVTARLTCDAHIVSVEVAKQGPVANYVDVGSTKLVAGLVKQYCP